MKEVNMKTLYSGAAVTLILAGALPAFAGGPVATPPEPAPLAAAPAPVMPTGGDWTGGSVGLSLSYGNDSFAGGSGTGALYGVRGAYDYDFGGWVLGGEASYDWADIGAGGSTLKDMSRVGLRVGPDLGDTFLYVTGGAAMATQSTGGVTATDNGWYAGIGAEHRFSRNWSVGAELLTNRFSNFNGSGSELNATTAAVNVNYRF
jgi:hypothetical protein